MVYIHDCQAHAVHRDRSFGSQIPHPSFRNGKFHNHLLTGSRNVHNFRHAIHMPLHQVPAKLIAKTHALFQIHDRVFAQIPYSGFFSVSGMYATSNVPEVMLRTVEHTPCTATLAPLRSFHARGFCTTTKKLLPRRTSLTRVAAVMIPVNIYVHLLQYAVLIPRHLKTFAPRGSS